MAKLIKDGVAYNTAPSTASQLPYNNSTSGLSATDVKGALDELASEKADSSSLATVATSGSYTDLSNTPQIDTSLDTTSSNAIANGPVASFAQAISQTVSDKMNKADPTGTGSLSINRKAETTVGSNSATLGLGCTASANQTFAAGYNNEASGVTACAVNSTNKASGAGSFCSGYGNIAQRQFNHVFGMYNQADTGGTDEGTKGNYIEIVGKGTNQNSRSNARTLDWSGNEVLAGDLTINGNQDVGAALNALSGMSCQVIRGNTSWKAQSTGSGLTSQPYGIFIFGYTVAYVASSVSPYSDLSTLTALIAVSGSAALTLTNGVLKFGTDANRQFVCLMPNSVRLVQQT